MDHKVVPRPCKICDWPLNSSRDQSGLHQGKNVKVTMKFEVHKRHILRPTLSTDMVQRVLQWEKQKRCSSIKRQGPMAKKCCFNQIFMILFYFILEEEKMKTKEDKRMVKLCFFLVQKCLFVTHTQKSTHSLFGAWAFLLVHIWFAPSNGPKGYINWFWKKSAHESWTMKSDHGKGPSSMVHGVNRP